jgi:hypothetical protein
MSWTRRRRAAFPSPHQLANLGADIRRHHERLADQSPANAGPAQAHHVVSVADTGLAYDDAIARHARNEAHCRGQVGPKDVQVSVVDPYQLRPGRNGLVQLSFVMDFDEGRHAQFMGDPEKTAQFVPPEGCDDQ